MSDDMRKRRVIHKDEQCLPSNTSFPVARLLQIYLEVAPTCCRARYGSTQVHFTMLGDGGEHVVEYYQLKAHSLLKMRE